MHRHYRVTAAVIALSVIAPLSACAGAEPTADETSDPSSSVNSSPSGPAEVIDDWRATYDPGTVRIVSRG